MLLTAAAAVVLLWQVRAWKQLPKLVLDERESTYRHRQSRRRLQASGMLFAASLAMTAALFIPWRRFPTLFVVAWCAIALVVGWVVLLALADSVANYQFWSGTRRHTLVEQAKLRAELMRHEPEKRNGHR